MTPGPLEGFTGSPVPPIGNHYKVYFELNKFVTSLLTSLVDTLNILFLVKFFKVSASNFVVFQVVHLNHNGTFHLSHHSTILQAEMMAVEKTAAFLLNYKIEGCKIPVNCDS